MSRAFVKEMDDVLTEPALQRPQSRPMTRAGLERLRERLASATDENERRALDDAIAAAIVVAPPAERGVAAFGATVTVSGAGPKARSFTIVGEDEIDVESGRIGASSPLATALLGSHVGDVVVWRRPAGPAQLTITHISYDQ
ncbi:MAG: GreA/GreB family elongation factor [Candidatus Eremiobacteraeota bacterium]|nr:GreA/GreB family elongation factor [Candidatus Eremiobacteraeota bacterium]MBV9646599.1 GreA/GreB family elongation factor [Candidatus Eremiobacteraeota bacterium]